MSRQRELEFLIACATPPGRFDGRGPAALSPEFDWAGIEALALYHRVRPLLFRRAQRVPASVRAGWEASSRAIALRNLNLTAELISVATSLAAVGVPVLPHKGPTLALAAYGDLTLREFADLDVLTAPETLAEAIKALGECGYAPDAEIAWLPPTALRRWTGEIACVSADGSAVDLHWRLTPPGYPIQLASDLLWRHAAPLEIAGTTLMTLRPEALFLLLAVHGAKHGWEALGWLADLAWLVESQPPFDWGLTMELGAQSGCERTLSLAAALIHEVFQSHLPDCLARQIAADLIVARLVNRVLTRWHDGHLAPPGSMELLQFVAALSSNRATTIRHAFGLVLNPTEAEWRARRLPERLFFLYAPGRLLRLATKSMAPRKRP